MQLLQSTFMKVRAKWNYYCILVYLYLAHVLFN